MNSVFARYSNEDVRALVTDYPLAWILPLGGPTVAAGLLPLLGEYANGGSLVALVGHMSRRNPLITALANDSRAAILFAGPQGYVSPSHAGIRDWGPTWNFAQLAIDCEVEILEDLTEEAIDRLVTAMEPAGPDAWRPVELGGRYPAMLGAIIGFRARVIEIKGRFKLGQDEEPDVLGSILSRHPDPALVDWMRRMNERRD
jgi:transcriptional regulator